MSGVSVLSWIVIGARSRIGVSARARHGDDEPTGGRRRRTVGSDAIEPRRELGIARGIGRWTGRSASTSLAPRLARPPHRR